MGKDTKLAREVGVILEITEEEALDLLLKICKIAREEYGCVGGFCIPYKPKKKVTAKLFP